MVDFNFTEREPSVTLRTREPPNRPPPFATFYMCVDVQDCIASVRAAIHIRSVSKKACVILMNNAAGKKFVPSLRRCDLNSVSIFNDS